MHSLQVMDLWKLHDECSLLLGDDHHCSIVGVIFYQLNQSISHISGAKKKRCRDAKWQTHFFSHRRQLACSDLEKQRMQTEHLTKYKTTLS